MKFSRIDIESGAFGASVLETADDGQLHRRAVTPDDDISDLPATARSKITEHWASMDMAEWDRLAHPPADPVTAADIKAEAKRRILALLPAWKQRNLTARGVELTLARAVNGKWSDAEAAEAAGIQAQWDKVKAIRAASDDLEKSLPTDYTADARWPSA